MKGDTLLLHLFCILFLFFGASSSSAWNGYNNDTNTKQVYIVYMGAADSTNASLRNDHAQILNSVLKRDENALVRNYRHGFSGFAARLSKEEANSIAQKPGVVSVFPDPILKLYTTRSWYFLEQQTRVEVDTKPNRLSNSSSSSDIILGILDTGIWQEDESFNDEGMGPIPSRWKGTCMTSNDFNSSNCNRKLIGARYYPDPKDQYANSPRDYYGHGTHVASTAVGAVVRNASFYGLAAGTAKGGSPESRLAIYKVCPSFFCLGSAIMAAFDDAIADGVDVMSLSLGSSGGDAKDLIKDPIAIGAFHAVERGILVVCAAGNSGPVSKSLENDAPWILTVAASSIDRDFQSNLVLGDHSVISGRAINFSPLSSSPDYRIISGELAKANDSKQTDARQCDAKSMDGDKIKGKIVVCENVNGDFFPDDIITTIKDLGGIGLALITHSELTAANFGDFPVTVINPKDGSSVLQYLNSTSNPMATVQKTVTVFDNQPAPMVVEFSSRGPSMLSSNILKPDIAAPGVNILAAWNNNTDKVPEGREPSRYNIISGTSMACPHVSGLACYVKTHNPTWSPSAIKSAIMTSAIQNDNLKDPIRNDSGGFATPYDYGAGEITTSESLQPGLVYETNTIDYLYFLCYIKLNISTIKIISRTAPANFSCPENSSFDLISNLNYPSIAVNLTGKGEVNVIRTVTNVGEEDETVYSPIVDAPSSVDVTLTPDKLQFTESSKKLSYGVTFSALTPLEKDLFGSITWSNDKYTVRIPFVLTK
ncbi:hypothetical protein VNO80_17642 [Phaseolus coccineus]|uniref:Uncharacterized protein n=1 Tax=Phaseolus coccineus TaxID=3886 RepID=A0AAN9MIW9_PHACN